MKKGLLTIFCFTLVFLMYSCGEKEIIYEYGEEQMVENIWDTKIVYNETVLLIEEDGVISGSLLFAPKEIIGVRDYSLQKEYLEGEYVIDGNIIIATKLSTMPFLTENQASGDELKPDYAFSTYQAKEAGEVILFTEGAGIVMHHIAVSYTHEAEWDGPIPKSQANYLPNFISSLEAGEDTNVVFYGDSIFTGCNASSKLGIQPFQKDFPNLFINELQKSYLGTINLFNTSMGGMTSSWGKVNLDGNVLAYQPDLVIIGFGMNDGSFKVTSDAYKLEIETMIKQIQNDDSSTDILLVSTILANPESIQNQNQADYLPVLQELSETYQVGLVDMTSMSAYLLQTKNSLDIYANNINHPSDFLVRIYAMSLLTALEEEVND